MIKNRSKIDKMLILEPLLKNAWKMMTYLAFGYSKTVVSLQKVGKTTPEIVPTCPQNPLKSGSEGSPKRSLKLQ